MENKSNKILQIEYSDFNILDRPTQFNNPTLRAIINIISAGILGINFTKITDSYFVTMMIFAIPILLDYLRFKPADPIRRRLYRAGKFLVLVVFWICLFGMVGILAIVSFEETPHILVREGYVIASGWHFPAYILWLLMAANILLSVVDIFVASTKAEKKINSDSCREEDESSTKHL